MVPQPAQEDENPRVFDGSVHRFFPPSLAAGMGPLVLAAGPRERVAGRGNQRRAKDNKTPACSNGSNPADWDENPARSVSAFRSRQPAQRAIQGTRSPRCDSASKKLQKPEKRGLHNRKRVQSPNPLSSANDANKGNRLDGLTTRQGRARYRVGQQSAGFQKAHRAGPRLAHPHRDRFRLPLERPPVIRLPT